MAKIGVRKMFYAIFSADDTYTGCKKFGKISTFNFTPTSSNVKDYGDDVVAEVSNELQGGTLSIEANQLTLEERGTLLGHDYTNGVLTVAADDQAPYVGVGAIAVELASGVKQYAAKWYNKLMFREPNDENSTKQENVSFAHTTIEADVIPQDDYTISAGQVFETEKAAETWIRTQADDTFSAKLTDLDVGELTLTPSFSSNTTSYTAATTNASDKITFVTESDYATVVIASDDAEIAPDGTAEWDAGENVVTVSVTDGSQSKVYTVTVTKS